MTASSDEQKQSQHKLRKQYRVDEKRVKAALLLVKARIVCQHIKKTSQVGELIEILSELGHFDLAVQLAISHDESPAYSLCMLLRKEKDVNEVARYMSELNGKQAVEFARYLIADCVDTGDINLPVALEVRILEQKLVSPLIAIYMSEDCGQLVPAVRYLKKYASAGSIKILAETDINLLVKVLQTSDMLIDLQKQEL